MTDLDNQLNLCGQVLGSNRLAEVPPSVAQLPKLARLDLSDNCLTTVPPALGHIRALKELDLRCAASGF